jgi:dTDP-4-dehydrorhamnose 3,5-epimerase
VNLRQTDLPDVVIVTPQVFRDDRGFLLESFNLRAFSDAGIPTDFVQNNHSRSVQGVLRGLHYQLQAPQGKLVRCVRGSIFDVAVDIRVGSPTFGKWVGAVLDDVSLEMIWIPPGFAHGFCATSNVADVDYKCTEFYAPSSERGLAWNDPSIGITWPLKSPRLSAKDASYPTLASASAYLPRYPSTSR